MVDWSNLTRWSNIANQVEKRSNQLKDLFDLPYTNRSAPPISHVFPVLATSPLTSSRFSNENLPPPTKRSSSSCNNQTAAYRPVSRTTSACPLSPMNTPPNESVGKSLCYQFPAVAKLGVTKGVRILISPFINLITDQVQALCAKHIGAASSTGTMSAEGREYATGDLRSVKPALCLVYLTPEMWLSVFSL
ncbi:hypothetical protein KEM48_005374 [Puccinia striiformis f. sp. tritici PST-130]|uniref:Uncharacterized protein n=1 Tax=Puccinia striiformis f. sp. tritici PST-78 TaxID=1165861 RepID=A0A0L0VH57_9BASI|nr:hypothetical protein KEM48_005374 [Puccinia striiformis f. sp. tritici PST-130]KNE98546.1 hypothetical protein PSTG_08098 [Puccinia striiformis f. sp. tritici PST-78]